MWRGLESEAIINLSLLAPVCIHVSRPAQRRVHGRDVTGHHQVQRSTDIPQEGPLFLKSSKSPSTASRNVFLTTSLSLINLALSKNVSDMIRCNGSSLKSLCWAWWKMTTVQLILTSAFRHIEQNSEGNLSCIACAAFWNEYKITFLR